MTPTEQENELQKAVWASLASQITHAINCTDLEHENQDSCEDFTKKNFEQLMKLIIADRKRVALEAFDEGYEAGRKEKPPKLVDAIEFRRESYGWSKGKMAAMLDMTKGHYSEFIHGTRGLPVNSIRKAYAIGIPAQVLLQDDIDQRLKAQQEQL